MSFTNNKSILNPGFVFLPFPWVQISCTVFELSQPMFFAYNEKPGETK